MRLGAFSVGLAVKDIEASREFYDAFGFNAFGGDILAFNPGWDSNARRLP